MALAHIGKGEPGLAKAETTLMDASLRAYKERVKMPIPEALKVARRELDGQLQIARGKVGRGMRRLHDASREELRLVYSEPPYYPRPVSEALGEIAMKHGRAAEAEAAFRIALQQYPNSFKAQKGLRAALTEQNKALIASAVQP